MRSAPSSDLNNRSHFVARRPTPCNIDKVLHIFGSHGIMAGVLLTILGVGVGWLVGGANADARRVLALSTGTRNFTIALVLASRSFDDPRVEIMVIVAAVVGFLIVLPVCWVWRIRPVAID